MLQLGGPLTVIRSILSNIGVGKLCFYTEKRNVL